MYKSFSKIQAMSPYKFDIISRCGKLGIPYVRKCHGNAINENYLGLLFYKPTYMDMYMKVYDWIEKFDDDLKEYLYAEMFDMSYEELSKFLIRKELI